MQLLVSSIDYNEYVGRIAVGRIERGTIKVNQEVAICDYHDPDHKAKGKVVACGEGKYAPNGTRIPMQVKVGDTVLLNHGAGQTIKDGEEELTLVYESEILAIAD